METGSVKWFDSQKGYGFIVPDGENEDVFFHFSEILMEGFKKLDPGERVGFDKKTSPKGWMAIKISRLES